MLSASQRSDPLPLFLLLLLPDRPGTGLNPWEHLWIPPGAVFSCLLDLCSASPTAHHEAKALQTRRRPKKGRTRHKQVDFPQAGGPPSVPCSQNPPPCTSLAPQKIPKSQRFCSFSQMLNKPASTTTASVFLAGNTLQKVEFMGFLFALKWPLCATAPDLTSPKCPLVTDALFF